MKLFMVGDLVWLKSGGPKMTVVRVVDGLSREVVEVTWFTPSVAGGWAPTPNSTSFPVDALVAVPK